jgi:FkbM family methyltransferase
VTDEDPADSAPVDPPPDAPAEAEPDRPESAPAQPGRLPSDAVDVVVPAVPLTACTVATVHQLPAVRVLARSFADHHPGARLHALLVDCDRDDVVDLRELGRLPEGAEFLHPTALGISEDDLARLRTACRPEQLCAVLRPRLMRALAASVDTSGPVLHLDPSVLVLGPIVEPVLAGLVEHSLVLLPRLLGPLPEDGLRPDPAELRAAGLFDPSLIAVNRGADAFLQAWAEHALREPDGADSFLDGAALLLDHHVLRDPGIGLSVWNAGQRPLHADERGAVTVAGVPLRTVHFAGFDPNRPWLLSADVAERPRILLSEHRLLARLCSAYVGALSAASRHGDPVGVPQRIGSSVLPAGLRVRYRAAWLAAERDGTEAPPALTAAPVDFLAWACAPDEARGSAVPASTRWAASVWADDPGLRRRFADPFGVDADVFREWCAGPGVSSGALPPEAVPPSPGTETRLTDQLGVSVLGDGQVARLLRAAAAASGLPVSSEPDYPVVLCCTEVPAGLVRRRYVIAAPDADGALSSFRGADEAWTLTQTARAELDGVIGLPVHAIPLPVLDVEPVDVTARENARTLMSWPDKPDAVVFVAVVDHANERVDNAVGTVTAFTAAFADRNDVRLLILVDGADRHPEAAERLRLATADDDRVELVEQASPEERPLWLDTADCLLALHRSERSGTDRIGLVVAASAARGLPVIGVDGGAISELLARDGALLMPTGPDGREADLATVVTALRAVADDPDAAAQLGRIGRSELLRGHAITVSGARLRDRVEHAYHTWRTHSAAARAPQGTDPLLPLRSARHVLLREPDVAVGHKIPMAPALRKAVLRVLNHYDAHMRTVLGTLVDGMERTVEEVVARQDDSGGGGELAELRLVSEQLDRMTERVAHLDDRLIGVDDGALRARADLTGQSRRLAEVEDAVVGEAAKRNKQLAMVTDRMDRLTEVLDRTLDRMAELDSRVGTVLREHDSRGEVGLRAASQALQASDALRRVVLRDHERRDAEHPDALLADQPPSSLVLSDAGLLRLPSDDGVMLPLLSSNGVWEPNLTALIDSLVEPDGVFLDIGAYVGYHTLRVLSRLGTSGAVVAVEPSIEATKLLRYNVSVNVPEVVADRLVVVPAAAWDTAGVLAAEPAMTGGVLVRPMPSALLPNPLDGTAPPETTEVPPPSGPSGQATPSGPDTVPSVRLDREFEKVEGLRGMPLSVVKVDIPGRGHRALGGLVRLLRRDRPHVFCAFSAEQTAEIGDDPITVLREFDTWGFDVLLLGDTEPSTPQRIVEVNAGQHSTTLWLRPRGKPA